jgi:WD40 repeat protein
LLRILCGHLGRVSSLALSPSGDTLATGGQDGRILLWSPATGRLLRTIEAHPGSVGVLSWTHDGKRILSSGKQRTNRHSVDNNGDLFVWNPVDGASLDCLKGHPQEVIQVVCSSDGRFFASADVSGVVRLWEADSGRYRRTIRLDSPALKPLAFSPDGAILATSDQKTTRLWDPATGKPLPDLADNGADGLSLSWSPDGRLFYRTRAGTSWLTDPAGKRRLRLGPEFVGVWKCWSGNGKRVYFGGVAGAYRVEGDKFTKLWWQGSLSSPAPDRVAFSPDGHLAVVSAAGFQLLDGQTGGVVAQGDST